MLEAKTAKRREVCARQVKLALARKTLTVVFLIGASFAGRADAQYDQIVIAPEPVGSGARALGQSAFIAVADDATAASWNPAGLINLERPEASLVGAWRSTTYDYSSGSAILSSNRDSWEEGQINFMSYAHPMNVGNTDMVLSVNYHQVYDFGLDFHCTVNTDPAWTCSASSKGAISAYSLAAGFAMPSHPQITFGASFNWHTQSFLNSYAWQTRVTWSEQEPFYSRTETFDDFRGYNFTLGLLWDAYERQEHLLTFGLVLHTPFTAEVDRETRDSLYPTPQDEHLDMDFPLSLGAGVNYRFSDRFSMAFDVDWKQWSEFKQTDQDGNESPPIGDGVGDIADTLALRLGGERLWFSRPGGQSVYALRGGVFYEPRPALDDAMPVYGISLGAGWTLKERFSLDFAYQYRWGEEIEGGNLGRGVQELDYNIREHFLVGSVVIYF